MSVSVEHAGREWVLIAGSPPEVMRVRDFADIETAARELAAAVGGPGSAPQLSVSAGAHDVLAIERTIVEARAAAERAHRDYVAASRSGVAALREVGVPVRDVAEIVGVSAQRVSQLARNADV